MRCIRGAAAVCDGNVLYEHVATARLTMRVFSEEYLDRYLDDVGNAAMVSVGGYQLEGAARNCSSASKAIISPCLACRCCRCWNGCAASGCWRCSIMFILGLTGSIAMGKSTTARLFAEEGVPVYDADAAVHRLYEGEAAPAIEAAFPGSTRDGKVDRAALSQHIVGDAEKLKFLESIVHPLVGRVRDAFLADAEASGAKVAVLDIPLLFETGGESRVDAVVVVSAPAGVQRARMLERGIPEDRLDALLARQMPDAEKRRRADFVVDTSGGIEFGSSASARNSRRRR